MNLDGIHKREKTEVFSSKDQYFVEQMAERELEHLAEASKLDREIQKVVKSTRVLIPSFSIVHNYLRMKYPCYYRWHLHEKVVLFHWIILIFAITTFFTIILFSFI